MSKKDVWIDPMTFWAARDVWHAQVGHMSNMSFWKFIEIDGRKSEAYFDDYDDGYWLPPTSARRIEMLLGPNPYIVIKIWRAKNRPKKC